jgi:hypothetical protein
LAKLHVGAAKYEQGRVREEKLHLTYEVQAFLFMGAPYLQLKKQAG